MTATITHLTPRTATPHELWHERDIRQSYYSGYWQAVRDSILINPTAVIVSFLGGMCVVLVWFP